MSIIWSTMACVSSVFYQNSTENFITGMNAKKVFGLLTYFSISSFIFGLIEIVQFGILIKASVIVFGSHSEWKNEENISSNMYCDGKPFLLLYFVLIYKWIAFGILICCLVHRDD